MDTRKNTVKNTDDEMLEMNKPFSPDAWAEPEPLKRRAEKNTGAEWREPEEK